MSSPVPSAGTVTELQRATGVSVRTLQRWARAGLLTRVGTAWPPRYDGHQVMRVKRRRMQQGRELAS